MAVLRRFDEPGGVIERMRGSEGEARWSEG